MSIMNAPQPGRAIAAEDTFALRLHMLRFIAGQLSQEQAAALTGQKASTWATWENGAKPRGMNDVVSKIADGLGCDKGWLMFGGPITMAAPPEGPRDPSGQGITASGWIEDEDVLADVVTLHAANNGQVKAA